MLAGLFLLPLTELRQRFESLAGLADPATWTAQLSRGPPAWPWCSPVPGYCWPGKPRGR